MKTLSSLKTQLAALKRNKKELKEALKDENLFNKRSIFIRIRILDYKIWKIKRELENFV